MNTGRPAELTILTDSGAHKILFSSLELAEAELDAWMSYRERFKAVLENAQRTSTEPGYDFEGVTPRKLTGITNTADRTDHIVAYTFSVVESMTIVVQ